MSYMAACTVKMIQLRLRTLDLFMGSRLECMRNQKCTIYSSRIVTDTPQREVRETYDAFGIKCLSSVSIVDGVLQYIPPKPDGFPIKKKHRKRNPAVADQSKAETKQTKAQSELLSKRRGRPKGSKNKKTLERKSAVQAQVGSSEKKKRGRPKGSKNKRTLEREILTMTDQ